MPWVRTGIDRRGLNKKVAHTAQPGVPSIFLTHFDVFYDPSQYRPTTTWITGISVSL